ncbi:snapalysin family zinc-dependent metalloprotease [Actinomadura sp. KC345]|uniref:snapalysin family zinc-dependent metalloprotease n=1 Tax=Actinomadura sp. KC345 TaxID=2530371 RepID=UPI0010531410|nr:snapalysin family zinc-dependent metalloprotease [Actinomadura sp. KC345]TDC42599.1 snapalysin family zinc-dependent metalloprotease [Actinomadura sp. KC345]
MVIRNLLRVCAALLLGLAFLAGTGASASASESSEAVRTVRYDASRAAEFRTAVDEGAQIWNEHVANVRLVPGTPADVVVLADDGWPRARVTGLGRGTIWMGRQAVRDGHYTVRIASHEFGHILGLPDRRTGRCTDLMSGASAGTSCRNPNPNSAEIAEVEGNFQNGRIGVTPGVTLTEAPAPVR